MRIPEFILAGLVAQLAAGSVVSPLSTPTTLATSTIPATPTTPGNGIMTPAPIQSGMVANCNQFHDVISGDTCLAIVTAAGISLADFYIWNPAVGSDCSTLWLGYYVCTGVFASSSTSTPTPTTTTSGISTPTPIQTGMVSGCTEFYQVASGDTCQTVASAAGISLASFYSWNPAVGSDCSTLWLGYYVCIAVGASGTTATTTTTTSGTGVATPTPTEPGMVNNCNNFHAVVSGDTCVSIASAAGITPAQFEEWNSGVGSDCSTLWLGYYVCIGVV